MAKMRVLKRDEKEFQRLKRNYRSKINRIRKTTGFSLDDIDSWLGVEIPSIKDLRSGKAFSSRKDYNNWKQQMNSITKRSFTPLKIETNSRGMRYPRIVSTKGKSVTKKAQQQVDEMVDEFSDLPVYSDGEIIGKASDRQLALSDREAFGLYKPEDFDIENYSNPKSIEKNISRNEERQEQSYYDERMEQMRENFISMFSDTDDEDNEEIVDRIRKINPRDFYEMYLMIPEMAFEDWDSDTGSYISGDKSPSEVIGYYLDLYESGKLDLTLKDVG